MIIKFIFSFQKKFIESYKSKAPKSEIQQLIIQEFKDQNSETLSKYDIHQIPENYSDKLNQESDSYNLPSAIKKDYMYYLHHIRSNNILYYKFVDQFKMFLNNNIGKYNMNEILDDQGIPIQTRKLNSFYKDFLTVYNKNIFYPQNLQLIDFGLQNLTVSQKLLYLDFQLCKNKPEISKVLQNAEFDSFTYKEIYEIRTLLLNIKYLINIRNNWIFNEEILEEKESFNDPINDFDQLIEDCENIINKINQKKPRNMILEQIDYIQERYEQLNLDLTEEQMYQYKVFDKQFEIYKKIDQIETYFLPYYFLFAGGSFLLYYAYFKYYYYQHDIFSYQQVIQSLYNKQIQEIYVHTDYFNKQYITLLMQNGVYKYCYLNNLNQLKEEIEEFFKKDQYTEKISKLIPIHEYNKSILKMIYGQIDQQVVFNCIFITILFVQWQKTKKQNNFNFKLSDIKFKDVKGIDNCLKEVTEVVQFLKDDSKFSNIGAVIPRGILLYGPPGCGKTLIAKAIAGEAGVNFLAVSGSDFVERFVGVGAKRVRELFDKARQNKPCIIFIDEIDSIGKKRDYQYVGNDERDTTLNQILVEMDGFNTDSQIIVIAATNRKEILDQAILRPGRFDRQVKIDYPSLNGRKEILQLYLSQIQTDENIDELIEKSSQITQKFSGAELKNLVNESCMIAVREKVENVKFSHIQQASDRIINGITTQRQFSKNEKELLSFQQACKAVVSHKLGYKVIKCSIQSRSKNQYGFIQVDKESLFFEHRDQILNKICYLISGKVGLNMKYKSLYSVTIEDQERVQNLCFEFINKSFSQLNVKNLIYENQFKRNFSEFTQNLVDQEIQKIIDQQSEISQKIIENDINLVNKINNQLLDQITLDEIQIKQIFNEYSNQVQQ